MPLETLLMVMGGGDNQQGDLSWYDVFSIIYPIAPVAIIEYYELTDNNNIIFLKDISIKNELPFRKEGQYDGMFLYDRNDLGRFYDNNSYAPHHPDAYKYNSFTNNGEVLEGLQLSEFGIEPYRVTINGEDFYYYATD